MGSSENPACVPVGGDYRLCLFPERGTIHVFLR